MLLSLPDRKARARARRDDATALSTAGKHPLQVANEDEFAPYMFSFTKGMAHDATGLISDPDVFEAFRAGTEDPDPQAFAQVTPYRGDFPGADLSGLPDPLDHYRRWQSPTEGHSYTLQGPDSFAVTMPPAPEVGSAEFGAEMAELYQMALCRDLPVAALMHPALIAGLQPPVEAQKAETPTNIPAEQRTALMAQNAAAAEAAARLSDLRWFAGLADDNQPPELRDRRRGGNYQTVSTLFRGAGEDIWATPYLSQFLVMGSGGGADRGSGGGADRGTDGHAGVGAARASGEIRYGAQRIPQTVRVAQPGRDYMTGWQDWLNVQNGLNARATLPATGPGAACVDGAQRPLTTLRDMACYVHDDALTQAYTNAALILLNEGFAFDRGLPFHAASKTRYPSPGARKGDSNRAPYVLFGAPHLMALVSEVASRALKAVQLQKFAVHRRLRPEAAGALFHMVQSGYMPHGDLPGATPFAQKGSSKEAVAREALATTVAAYTYPHDDTVLGTEPALEDILEDIRAHNDAQNGGQLRDSWLLPMAYPEGAPMAPAYGGSHAAVAGACVTLLKAFFAMTERDGAPVYLVEEGGKALVPAPLSGSESGLWSVSITRGLTLESELNKLMSNIALGRNIAGVHSYSDYVESALLGEAITLGLLREQMVSYHAAERVSFTIPLLAPRSLPGTLRKGGNIRKDEPVRVVRITPKGVINKLR